MKTKFNLKTLLVVAILLISMCLFNTNMVQAADAKADKTKTKQEEMDEKIAKLIPDTISVDVTESETLAELEKGKELEGTYTYSCKAKDLVANKFNDILKSNGITLPIIIQEGSSTTKINYEIGFKGESTYEAQFDMKNVDIHTICIYGYKSVETGGSSGSSGGETEMKINIKYSTTDNNKEILNSLADTITLDIKESDVDLEKLDNGETSKTLNKITSAIKKQLVDKGYSADTKFEIELCYIDEEMGTGSPINIHKVEVILGNNNKIVKINYSNTSQYNKADETYVKNKVNSIKFAKFKEDGIELSDAVFTMYNIGDEENANKWTFDTFDFNKLLNDKSITIKKTYGLGGMGGATPWGTGACLYFYKNDVLYATKFVMNMGAYGTTLENGTPVNMARLEKDDEVYKAMAKELEKDELKNIIGCYELEAFGETYDNMKVSFNIGTNYNGKEVQILHKKSDNTYETFTTKVENGKASITVNEFSPFMIALKDNETSTKTPSTPNKVLDDEPKTGVYDYTIFASVVLLISLGGIAVLKFKK